MTTTDWIIDIALVLIVFRQVREEPISKATFIVPIAMISFAAKNYLHGIPTAGNDLVLIALFAAVGVVFGLFGGLLTRVRAHQGRVYIKASAGAAALWVISMGFRLAFAVWSSHPSGRAHLVSFSAAHHITTGQAWVTALILMAFGEVVVRLGTVAVRAWVLSSRADQGRPGSQAWAQAETQTQIQTQTQAQAHEPAWETAGRR